jgi:uncharacterized damage-inducible protein DinB
MYTILKHLDYAIWATTKVSQILENTDESIWKKETPSSFNTLEKTALHIWDAEHVWLKRLQGESLTDWPSKDFKGDKSECLKGWLDNLKGFRDQVASKDEDYLQSVISYKNIVGKPYSNTVEEIIYHVVNHGTFHRGQIITMLRANDCTDWSTHEELASTDLITYLRVAAT